MSSADPYRMLQDVCDREFGFQPLNFSIKPVHVANGLAQTSWVSSGPTTTAPSL